MLGAGELLGLIPDAAPLLVFSTAECLGAARIKPGLEEVGADDGGTDNDGAEDEGAEVEFGVPSLRFLSLSHALNLTLTILRGFVSLGLDS